MKKATKQSALFTLLLFLSLLLSSASQACTRVVYDGVNGLYITARSMDWRDEIPVNLWLFPRGMERNGEAGAASLKWTSRYGSLIASTWDMASADGMNEKGLVANMLWLAESEYPAFDPKGRRKGLAISLWAQYVLDNFATVKETVTELRKEKFNVVSDFIPGTDRFTTLHLSVSDSTGDNAIFEYIRGKLIIHHDTAYNVMTNSPVFEEQLALNKYWASVPGTVMLPGTNRAADRFVRASYYIRAIPKTDNTRVAIASVFSVIRNCSVPFGISSPAEPNISSTRWRSVSDHKHRSYYFETVMTPNVFRVDMNKLNFSAGAPVCRLSLDHNETYSGEVSAFFRESAPFTFAGIR